MTGEVLGMELPGRITLSAEDSWTALMRLLSYALVFFLAFQFGRDRGRAQAMFGWLTIAGLAYAVFGLVVYWSGYYPDWLFGGKVLAHDVRSTFINRNHFATWQGLTMLCAMAWFYHRMAKPVVKPYAMPQDREAQGGGVHPAGLEADDRPAADGDGPGADAFARRVSSPPWPAPWCCFCCWTGGRHRKATRVANGCHHRAGRGRNRVLPDQRSPARSH